MIRPNVFNNLPIPGGFFTLPGDSVAFTTGPFISETDMVGAPGVDIFATSSTHECQINALLYDVSPRGFSRLVTHCAMMKSDMVPGEVAEFDFELIACAHRFKAGHKARLVLCAADPLYVFPSLVPSQYRVLHTVENPSSVTLPLMEAKSQV
jgi:predicted acyl esterase